jgi:serine protease Do
MDDYPPMARYPAQPYPARVAPSRFSRLPILLLLLLGIIVLAYVPALVQRISYSKTMGELQALREVLPKLDLKSLSKAFNVVYRKIKPSVVHISTVRTIRTNANELAMLPGAQYQQRAEGSGVIADEAGYIVTNQHVVEGFPEINVSLDDGTTLRAEVIGTDPAIDLAVLKVDATGLAAAEWGDSDKLEPGELVWAIGNPFGLDQTITAGIVSGKGRHLGRQMSPFQEFLQTDVAINPGNSGGPLVDIEGDVVGINAAIVGNTYEGVSFAVPSNLVRKSYMEIRSKGRVVRGYIGVGLATLDPLVAANLTKLGYPTDRTKGVVVVQLNRQGPAAKAGILPGDIITEFNGQPVADSGALTVLIGQSSVGAKVPVKIVRRGEEQTIEVTIEERPADVR